MANVLTDLIPDMFEAMDVVSRELVGFIPAVARSSETARAAMGQQVLVPITPAATGGDNTPAATAPDDGDAAIDNVKLAITKSKYKSVRMTGEETMGLTNAGTFTTIMADRFYQAMRALINEIETDLWVEAYKNASRAYGGSAGTAPFATAGNFDDFAGVLGILEQNGCPTNDLQLCLGHAAMQNLRGKQNSLFKVNEAGSEDMLRNGMTDRIMKFAIRHSDAITTHVAGSGTGMLINNGAGEAIGETTLAIDTMTPGATGIKAGDLITIAGDTNKYNVTTGLVAASGNIVVGAPGLRIAAADNAAITMFGSHVPNVAFHRSAIALATRFPAMPKGGDMANDVTQIVDPITGLGFEVAEYKQFHRSVLHVRLAWGVKAIKQAHIAVLQG